MDTLWLSSSVSQLQQIIHTAASFYTIAYIKVNPQKSTLISNTNSTPQINFMNSTITTQPIHTPFKFLDCWFTATLKYNKQIKLIKQEVSELNDILKAKNIIDKQATYIINNIIILIIE